MNIRNKTLKTFSILINLPQAKRLEHKTLSSNCLDIKIFRDRYKVSLEQKKQAHIKLIA